MFCKSYQNFRRITENYSNLRVSKNCGRHLELMLHQPSSFRAISGHFGSLPPSCQPLWLLKGGWRCTIIHRNFPKCGAVTFLSRHTYKTSVEHKNPKLPQKMAKVGPKTEGKAPKQYAMALIDPKIRSEHAGKRAAENPAKPQILH